MKFTEKLSNLDYEIRRNILFPFLESRITHWTVAILVPLLYFINYKSFSFKSESMFILAYFIYLKLHFVKAPTEFFAKS